MCGRILDPDWSSTDENLKWFLDGLEAGSFVPDRFTGRPLTPAWFKRFREQMTLREQWGREHFGYEYLARDNIAEGFEEACDGAMYSYLDVLKARRGGNRDDVDAALIVAQKFAEAYEALEHLRQRRGGAP